MAKTQFSTLRLKSWCPHRCWSWCPIRDYCSQPHFSHRVPCPCKWQAVLSVPHPIPHPIFPLLHIFVFHSLPPWRKAYSHWIHAPDGEDLHAEDTQCHRWGTAILLAPRIHSLLAEPPELQFGCLAQSGPSSTCSQHMQSLAGTVPVPRAAYLLTGSTAAKELAPSEPAVPHQESTEAHAPTPHPGWGHYTQAPSWRWSSQHPPQWLLCALSRPRVLTVSEIQGTARHFHVCHGAPLALKPPPHHRPHVVFWKLPSGLSTSSLSVCPSLTTCHKLPNRNCCMS